MLRGKFSVGGGKKVHFSKGNPQARYVAATENPASPTHYEWGFATNQYDYVGNRLNNNDNVSIASPNDGDVVDLFGWSTDAEHNNWGIHTQTGHVEGYTTGDFKDWDSALGTENTGWFTLSNNEFDQLINNNTVGMARKGTRYAKTTLNIGEKPITGVLVFPDGVALGNIGGFTINSYNIATVDYNVNQIAETLWTDLESLGVVLLPTAYIREGISITVTDVAALYWTCSKYNNIWAYDLLVNQKGMGLGYNGNKYTGYAVRLVRE